MFVKVSFIYKLHKSYTQVKHEERLSENIIIIVYV